VIEVRYSADSHEISFVINGVDLGVAFIVADHEEPLFPAVIFLDQGETVEIF